MTIDGVLSNSVWQRPSLLIQYMRSIGPGTVLWKSGSDSKRNDGSSHELLKWLLPQYAFQAIPDAHVKFESTSSAPTAASFDPAIQKNLVVEVTNEQSNTFKNYRRWSQTYQALQKRKIQLEKYAAGGQEFYDFVEASFQLAQTEPVVILGSPEGCLGYHYPESGPVPSFRRLLDDCGYSQSVQLFPQSDGTGLQLTPPQSQPIKYRFDDFLDISLCFLGRTKYGRTVLVLAGSRCSFGTLAAARIACDFWRHPINEIVNKAVQSSRSGLDNPPPGMAVYRTKWQLRSNDPTASPDFQPYSLDEPIAAELLYSSAPLQHGEFYFARLSSKLKRLEPPTLSSRSTKNPLVKHLLKVGPVSVVSKWYPEDLRDDGKAKDRLARKLHVYRYVPIAPGLPFDRDVKTFKDDITAMLFPQEPQDVAANPDSGQAESSKEAGQELWASLFAYDPQPRDLFKFWSIINEYSTASEEQKIELTKQLNQWFRIPSDGPVLVLGACESYAGYGWQQNRFNELIEAAGYPNRFKFQWGKGSSPLLDRRLDRQLKAKLLQESNGDVRADVGVIYLSKTVHQRDLIVVAGNSWLGTLAGVQLLFEEDRPEINRILARYLAGKLPRLEIAFKCQRLTTSSSSGVTPRSHAEADDVGEIDVTVLSSLNDLDYCWPKRSQQLFEPMFLALASEPGAKELHREYADDGFVANLSEDLATLTISCPYKYSAGDETIYPGDSFARRIKEIERLIKQYQKDRKNKPTSPYCNPFCILGPSGVGKEFFHLYISKLLPTPLGNASAINSLNCAGIEYTVLMSELFGHAKGAATDLTDKRLGAFRSADKGVLFLDEFLAVHEAFAPMLQGSLLRVIQTGKVRAVGEETDFPVQVHLVIATDRATTKEELLKLVAAKKVSAALYNRIQGQTFEIKPLADRPMEILPALLQNLNHHREIEIKNGIKISISALRRLLFNSWNGNFRDMRTLALNLPADSLTNGITRAHVDEALGTIASHSDFEATDLSQDRMITVKITHDSPDASGSPNAAKSVDELRAFTPNNWPGLDPTKLGDSNPQKSLPELCCEIFGNLHTTEPENVQKIIQAACTYISNSGFGERSNQKKSDGWRLAWQKDAPESIIARVVYCLSRLDVKPKEIPESDFAKQATDITEAYARKLLLIQSPHPKSYPFWAIQFMVVALLTGSDVRSDEQIRTMRKFAYYRYRTSRPKNPFPVVLGGNFPKATVEEFEAYMNLPTR